MVAGGISGCRGRGYGEEGGGIFTASSKAPPTGWAFNGDDGPGVLSSKKGVAAGGRWWRSHRLLWGAAYRCRVGLMFC